MKERPLLMNGEMVRATLDDRKSQTRRIIKKAWDGDSWAGDVHPAKNQGWIAWWPGGSAEFTKTAYNEGFLCPHGKPGDRLWVRETWFCCPSICHISKGVIKNMAYCSAHRVRYQADQDPRDIINEGIGWKPSIFMPRWASRITLEIVNVRVERLQSILEQDAIAEGILKIKDCGIKGMYWYKDYLACCHGIEETMTLNPIISFRTLWDSINKKKDFGWQTNPWVFVEEFKRIKP